MVWIVSALAFVALIGIWLVRGAFWRQAARSYFTPLKTPVLHNGADSDVVTTITNIEDERSLDAYHLAEQRALRRVTLSVARGYDPEAVFALAAQEMAALTDCDVALVARFDGEQIEVVGSFGDAAPRPGTRMPLGAGGALARVARRPEPVLVDYGELSVEDPLWRVAQRNSWGVGAGAPVFTSGLPWGGLLVSTRAGRSLPENTGAKLVSFSELVSLALAQAQSRADLIRRATSDPLTGLANHRSFQESLRRAVASHQRSESPLSLVVLDIDFFKMVNDNHGHQAGDQVLERVAALLRIAAREGDILGRVGGEEFAWILPDTTTHGAWLAAERLRKIILEEDFPKIGKISVSAGVASRPHGGSAADLFHSADSALLWAKSTGRNRCVTYRPDLSKPSDSADGDERAPRAQALAAVRALARAVDAKDVGTSDHSERVAEVAVTIARDLGWPDDRIGLLHEAALLHDVGKIGVPDSILANRDHLDADGRKRIQEHAALGSDIVSGLVSAEQCSWIRHHHERIDGLGFPDGLFADQIPEGARIITVADAWDAMTSPRYHRAAMSASEALEICQDGADTQFDAEIVASLERLVADRLICGPETADNNDVRSDGAHAITTS